MDPMRLLEYILNNYPDVYQEAVDNELLIEREQVAARLEAIDRQIGRPLTPPGQGSLPV